MNDHISFLLDLRYKIIYGANDEELVSMIDNQLVKC